MESPQGDRHVVAARLGLALKGPWLVPGGPPPALTAWTGLEKHCSHLVEGWFLARKAAWALSGCMATDR